MTFFEVTFVARISASHELRAVRSWHLHYSVPQRFVDFGQILCSTKIHFFFIPLLLRVVLIPKLNAIDVSHQ